MPGRNAVALASSLLVVLACTSRSELARPDPLDADLAADDDATGNDALPDDGGGPAAPVGDLRWDDPAPFGTVEPGDECFVVYTLTNADTADATSLALSPPAPPFSVSATTCASTLAPQASCTITTRFLAPDVGSFQGLLVVTFAMSGVAHGTVRSVSAQSVTRSLSGLAEGELDRSLGGAGYFTFAGTGGADDYGADVTTDSQGRIVITGTMYNPIDQWDMGIWRLSWGGTLDPSFAGTGYLKFHRWAYDWGKGVHVRADDRVVVGGYFDDGSSGDGPTLWRFTTGGALDTTFGETLQGFTRYWSGAELQGTDLAYDPTDDGYVVIGSQYDNWISVMKMSPTGTYVTSFGGTGRVVFNAVPKAFGARAAIDSLGRVIVTGTARPTGATGDRDMLVLRYLPNGTLDAAFNGTGYLTHDGAAGAAASDDVGGHLAVDASDDIYVAGSSTNVSRRMVVWKILGTNGGLDPTFGTNGLVTYQNTAGGNGNDVGNAIAVDPAGNLLVGGCSDAPGPVAAMTVWRLLANGALDATFGGGGSVWHVGAAGGTGGDCASAIIVEPTGRILVAGTSRNGTDLDLALWRLK